jgi:predicted transcriptional regulator
MKTVTVKADAEFDSLLTSLARRMNTTKSRIIRDAVRNYHQFIDREELKKKIQSASLKTRAQARQLSKDLDAADSDGL